VIIECTASAAALLQIEPSAEDDRRNQADAKQRCDQLSQKGRDAVKLNAYAAPAEIGPPAAQLLQCAPCLVQGAAHLLP
jgi:hypothetical protein